jgi:hypothetical protein
VSFFGWHATGFVPSTGSKQRAWPSLLHRSNNQGRGNSDVLLSSLCCSTPCRGWIAPKEDDDEYNMQTKSLLLMCNVDDGWISRGGVSKDGRQSVERPRGKIQNGEKAFNVGFSSKGIFVAMMTAASAVATLGTGAGATMRRRRCFVTTVTAFLDGTTAFAARFAPSAGTFAAC